MPALTGWLRTAERRAQRLIQVAKAEGKNAEKLEAILVPQPRDPRLSDVSELCVPVVEPAIDLIAPDLS
jgi:hypothetical protein